MLPERRKADGMKKVTIEKQELEYYSSEAIKTLRTNLLFCGEEKKVLVFTSCTQNEGKTYSILNLGIALSEIGKKVLIIDADLRKSVLLGRVHIDEKMVGLAHFLSAQSVLVDILYKTNITGLDFIFAGTVPPNPAELLSNNYFSYLLKTMRKEYDYILIDAPPIGSVIDAAVIAPLCDGSVLVVESGWNSWRFVAEIKEQLLRTGCPILGVILNKVDMYGSRYGYGRYGKYGQYGKYGYGRYGKYGRYSEYGGSSSKRE